MEVLQTGKRCEVQHTAKETSAQDGNRELGAGEPGSPGHDRETAEFLGPRHHSHNIAPASIPELC